MSVFQLSFDGKGRKRGEDRRGEGEDDTLGHGSGKRTANITLRFRCVLIESTWGFNRISPRRADREMLFTVETWIICPSLMQKWTMKSSASNNNWAGIVSSVKATTRMFAAYSRCQLSNALTAYICDYLYIKSLGCFELHYISLAGCFVLVMQTTSRVLLFQAGVTRVRLCSCNGCRWWKQNKNKQLILDDNEALKRNINIISKSIWHAYLKRWGLQMESTKKHLIMWVGMGVQYPNVSRRQNDP